MNQLISLFKELTLEITSHIWSYSTAYSTSVKVSLHRNLLCTWQEMANLNSVCAFIELRLGDLGNLELWKCCIAVSLEIHHVLHCWCCGSWSRAAGLGCCLQIMSPHCTCLQRGTGSGSCRVSRLIGGGPAVNALSFADCLVSVTATRVCTALKTVAVGSTEWLTFARFQ